MYHKFTFFYQSFSPFSQWYIREFHINGITFNCCEQYMMYCKAMLFEDYGIAEQIMSEVEPREQKRLGRLVKNFDQTLWDLLKIDIVYKGNYAKFCQNSELKKHLMATSGTTLVEASKSDVIWGIGIDIKDPERFDVRNWRGENLLGYALTRVREDILKEERSIQVINKYWNTLGTDVYLKSFLLSISNGVNTEVLRELELYHQQVTIANKDEDGEGISLMSFISTWTDLLIDKRLVALGDTSKPAKIVGWEILNSNFSYPFNFNK